MTYILLIIIGILLLVIFSLISSIKYTSLNKKFKSINIKYERFNAKPEEIKEVENQILEKGYWSQRYEVRMLVEFECRIEHKIENGLEKYITTVEFGQQVKFAAATIERAIVFKKIYENFQFELYDGLGWSSWKSKEHL